MRRLGNKSDNLAEVVGKPDEWDKKNLTALINNFKKDHFEVYGRMMTGQQWITYEVADAKEQNDLRRGDNPYGLKTKDSEIRVGTAIPYILWNAIEAAYPTIFRDKGHYNWFIKNFPEFRVTTKW